MIISSLTVFVDLGLLWMSRKPCALNFGHFLMITYFITLNYGVWGMFNFLQDFLDRDYPIEAQRTIDFFNFLSYGN